MIILLLAAILAFLYLCKKMGINVNEYLTAFFSSLDSKQTLQQDLREQKQPLAICFNNEYQDVAVFMLNCLMAIARACAINCPSSPSGIYCTNIVDRVRNIKGKYSFYYEVSVVSNAHISHGTLVTSSVNIGNIQMAIAQNLPYYMNYGYFFSGVVHVTTIGNNSVRIEICGVDRV